jgi:hypothetical protein
MYVFLRILFVFVNLYVYFSINITTMAGRKTTLEFIADARAVHGDTYDYSLTNYHTCLDKIKIICKVHGVFEQNPNNHLNMKQGCRECGKIKAAASMTYSQTEFIIQAKQIHGSRYDYSKVVYKKTSEKVIIICQKHGPFLTKPNKHIHGKRGCPKCGGKEKLSTASFIERSQEIHGDKYDYSKIEYISAHSPVLVICRKHGEFKQKANTHIRGGGCSICSGTKKKTTDVFIHNAKAIHGDKYDYSKVEYRSAHEKVTIGCRVHGWFIQKANTHVRGGGCSKCSYISIAQKQTKSPDEFIKESIKVHGSRYDYSLVTYKGDKNRVNIICSTHGVFKQSPNVHLRGSGCPVCVGRIKNRSISTATVTTDSFIERANLIHKFKFDYSLVNYKKGKDSMPCSWDI